MKTYTYQETLAIVEKFMEDSGIREYCTKVCKGSCCIPGCYNSELACHKNEGRRLSCSMYTCGRLDGFLGGYNPIGDMIDTIEDHICNTIHPVFGDHVFYAPHTLEVQSKCSFSCKVINQLKKIDTNKIKERIQNG